MEKPNMLIMGKSSRGKSFSFLRSEPFVMMERRKPLSWAKETISGNPRQNTGSPPAKLMALTRPLSARSLMMSFQRSVQVDLELSLHEVLHF